MKYRSDIDGLRAVAILLVLLCHVNMKQLIGGFIGVDVFFVISGFLITSIILKDIGEGTFTIRHFYERRVRRIFPALLATIGLSMLAAIALFDAAKLDSFARYSLASLFFYANIQTIIEAGSVVTKPLIHFWSLGVEEQFYIFYPLLVAVVMKYAGKRRLVALLLVLLAASFFAGVIFAKPRNLGFLGTHIRAWELLAGAILALGVIPPLQGRFAREGLAGLGLAMILFAFISFDLKTPFPSYPALLPVLGACFIIHAGMQGVDTFIGRAISTKGMLFIGKISYSVYLVHWPLIAFFRYADGGGHLTYLEQVLFFFGSILLGYCSWRFIEQPFRGREGETRFPDKKLVRIMSGGVAMLASLSAAILLS